MKHIKGFLIHFILISVCLFCLLPFLWLTSTALKGNLENIFLYPPVFIPKYPTLDNFKKVLELVPILKYVLNSFVVAFFTVILNLIFSSLAAYPLARMNFKGKNFVFFLILTTLAVPFQAIMLPVYIIILKLNLIDSVSDFNGYLGLILPFCVNAFGIFLLRQAFMVIPKEIEEQALIDGCNSFQIFYKILLPLIKPSLSLLAIFTFVGCWGEFLWPSIVLTKQSLFTLPVGINELQGAFSANYRLIAAGSIISIIPILLFFIVLQKYFIKGSSEGAVKG
ncbi:TPA: carbohydrate ABC transporter permease [Candidatus Galligastranaerophilus gallistercoris]|nr:carbohydrate ABC transporter permease [Candidatus Galligastranaerophilus gallistercoris]